MRRGSCRDRKTLILTLDDVTERNRGIAKLRDGVVEMPGGLGCPFCDAPAEYGGTFDRPTNAVCASNPDHVFVWLPWGG